MLGACCVHTASRPPSFPSPSPPFRSSFFSPAKASILSLCLVGLWPPTMVILSPSITQQGLMQLLRFSGKISNLIASSWYLVGYDS